MTGVDIYWHDTYKNRLYAAGKPGPVQELIAFEGTKKIWSYPFPENYRINDIRASENWILVRSYTEIGESMKYRLDVLDSDGSPAAEILPKEEYGYLGYIGLSKDSMLYYRSSDQSMVLRKLPDGYEQNLMTFSSRLVISTEAIGSLSARPGDHPLFSYPYLIIPGHDDIHVFRIDP